MFSLINWGVVFALDSIIDAATKLLADPFVCINSFCET
jgi:hypothetical protein